MERFKPVLLLTKELAIQNLVEQVCLINGYRVITAATIEDAHTLAIQRGQDVLVLSVIDADALVADHPQQADRTRRQWRAWIAMNAGLPLLFLGPMPPDSAFLADDMNPGGLLEKPFGPHALAGMIQTLLTEASSTGRSA